MQHLWWKFIFGEGFNIIGEMLGAENVFFNWLTDKNLALVALIIVATWQMAGYIKNSLIVTVISIAIIVVLASMCAWMLARTENKISKFIFMLFVATMLIPFQTLMMPLMQVLGFGRDTLHLPVVDTLGGLIFCYIGFGASMSVFLYHGFVKSVL